MTTKKVYLLSLGIILIASAYPINMGVVMLWAYIQNGGINAADYPSYVIPYTPICIAIIISTAIIPIAYRACKRLTLPALSILGMFLFLSAEVFFEKIVVFHQTEVFDEIANTSPFSEPIIQPTQTDQSTQNQALMSYIASQETKSDDYDIPGLNQVSETARLIAEGKL